MADASALRVAVVVSADVEWQAIRKILPLADVNKAPLGEWFVTDLEVDGRCEPVLYFHGGWGKIAAAASTQYVIDRWSPELLVNLGTCGGFKGEIERGTIILVERTIVYDIIEQMGDYDEHIAHYTTALDLSWVSAELPPGTRRHLLVSGDRDLLAQDLPELRARYGAIAGDWESGAIAWVAYRNGTRCLILRGVTDLVGESGGEAYGNMALFARNTEEIMHELVDALPVWICRARLVH